MKEEWEAVSVFDREFEANGRGDWDVSYSIYFFGLCQMTVECSKLLKWSEQKDYYKIIGVSRDTGAKTIKKALYVSL